MVWSSSPPAPDTSLRHFTNDLRKMVEHGVGFIESRHALPLTADQVRAWSRRRLLDILDIVRTLFRRMASVRSTGTSPSFMDAPWHTGDASAAGVHIFTAPVAKHDATTQTYDGAHGEFVDYRRECPVGMAPSVFAGRAVR